MSKIKISELRSKTFDELHRQQLDLMREYFKLRVRKKMGETPRAHVFKQVRRDIARIKTIITERGS